MNKFMQRFRSFLADKPLPPVTEREIDLIEKFKIEFEECLDSSGTMVREWVAFTEALRSHVNNDDIRSFLRWDVLKKTMFVGNADWLPNEIDFLKNDKAWESKWSKAIVESRVGNPLPSALFPASSGNLIHHAYHLAQFEEKAKSAIDKIEVVFEFGGGYGSMCRLVHNLGFSGDYLIFDLPYFSALQKFYLKSLKLCVNQDEEFGENNKGIFCVSDIETLKRLLGTKKMDSGGNSLFLATWSLSEVPLELRDLIFPFISNFNNLLIAYQDNAFGIDNDLYFKRFREKSNFGAWQKWKIKHLPGNTYVVGSP